MNKTVVWLGASVGSLIGSYLPMLWHADIFSPSSVILGGVGGLLGIWGVYKIYN